MKSHILFLLCVALIGTGAWIFFAYCHGTTGFQAGDSLSSLSIHLDITTSGFPAVFAVLLILAGTVLSLMMVIVAIVGIIRSARRKRPAAEAVESAL